MEVPTRIAEVGPNISSYSNIAFVFTLNEGPPAAPSGLAVDIVSSNQTRNIRLLLK